MAYDYALRLANGRALATPLLESALQKLTGASTFAFVGCDLANVTICPALESGVASVLVLYNPQSQARSSNIRLPVGLPTGVASYAAFDSAATSIVAQITPLTPVDTALRTEYYGYKSATPVAWLHFVAELPAMGYAAYFIVPSATSAGAPRTHLSKPTPIALGANADATVTNGIVTLTFDGSTGLLKSYANSENGFSGPLTHNWVCNGLAMCIFCYLSFIPCDYPSQVYYRSSTGTPKDNQASGTATATLFQISQISHSYVGCRCLYFPHERLNPFSCQRGSSCLCVSNFWPYHQ